MALSHETILGTHTEKPCVRAVYGVSGSGKTVFLREMLKEASRSKEYGPLWRGIVFDVKHDGYAELLPKKIHPARDMNEVVESMKKSRLTVVHPDVHTAQGFLDELIHHLFSLAQRVRGFTATLVLEESSMFITPHSLPDSLKRFATQGRSLGLSLVVANQRALGNKYVDTQAASITAFRLSRPDNELLKRRWGICPDTIEERLAVKKFSFCHFDLEELTLDFYEPIEMTSDRLTAKAEITREKPFSLMKRWFGPFAP